MTKNSAAQPANYFTALQLYYWKMFIYVGTSIHGKYYIVGAYFLVFILFFIII